MASQTADTLRLLQGEGEMAADNKLLGQFDLVGIPSAPRGVPQIEVVFDIDANGIVHVSAKDRATGKEQSMTISGQSTLAKDDIDRMVRDAEAHAEEDKKTRELVESRNRGEQLVHAVEKPLEPPKVDVPPGGAQRQAGETFAALTGMIVNHAKSTGRLDLEARWKEPVDDLAKKGPSNLL